MLCVMLFCVFDVLFGVKRVSGIGMEPSLDDGELVLYSRIFNDYAVGDVVLYEQGGDLLFSRIEAVDGREYYLMNDSEDSDVVGPVPVERLRGKVLSALKVRGI